MKKILILTLMISVLLVIPPAVIAEKPSINIESQLDTENIAPGEKFHVQLHLLNSGETPTEKINVQLTTSYPVSIWGISEKNISELSAEEEETLNFSAKIEETAKEGTYPMEFLIEYEDQSGNSYTKTHVVNVPVKGEKSLFLVLTESSKTDIYSDDTATLTFTLLNNGTAAVNSLIVEASTQGGLNVSWNSKERLIGKINPQESTNFRLTVETNEQVETGKYPLKLQLTGKNYTLEKTFPLPVKSLPEFTLKTLEHEKLSPGKTDGQLTLYLTNEGRETGKEVEGRLLPQYPFSTEETTKYIQEIKVNKTRKMTFWVDVEEDAKPGNYSLNLSLEYKAWGEDFTQTIKIPTEVQKGETLQMKIWWMIPIAIAILIAAYALKQKIQK